MTETDSTLLVVFLVPSLIALWRYENRTVSPEKRYLTFWPRFLAVFVDGMVFWPLSTIHYYVHRFDAPIWVYVTAILTYNSTHWAYSIFMHGRFGQTLGKMVTRVRIVDAKTDNAISFRHAFLRDCIPILFTIPFVANDTYELVTLRMRNETWPSGELSTAGAWAFGVVIFWLLAELITMLTNRKRRAIHDFVAGTVVVRTNLKEPSEEDLPPEPEGEPPPEPETKAKPRVKRRFSSVFR